MIRYFLLFVSASPLLASGFDTERELRTHLLLDYDRNSHPLRGTGSPTEVRLQVHVADLWSFDQKAMSFEADLYIRERWNDTRLSYSQLAGASQFSRVNLARSMGSVWRSALYFPAAIKETLSDELFFLYPDGNIWRSRRLIVKLKCEMHFQAFPYDSQVCPVRLESWSQTTGTIVLVADPATGVEMNTDNEWSDFTATQTTDTAEYSTGQYSYSTVFIRMQREMLGWRKTAIVPVVIFVLVSYSGYWISPGAAPARVTLAIISVLITLTLWSNVISTMPLVTYPVWLGDYIMGCVFFNLFSVFSYTVVNFGMQVRDAHKAKVADLKHQHALATESLHHEKTHNLLKQQLTTTLEAVSASTIPVEINKDESEVCPRGQQLQSDVPPDAQAEIVEKIVVDLGPDNPPRTPEAKTETPATSCKCMLQECLDCFPRVEKIVENVEKDVTEGILDTEKALMAVENTVSKFAMLASIDWHMRWIFPLCFGIYNMFMFVVFAGAYNLEAGS